MVRRTTTIILIGSALLAVLFYSLGYITKEESEPKKTVNALLVLGAGGLGDRAFNDAAYEGMETAAQEYGIRFRTAEFQGEEQTANLMKEAQSGFDLIIAVGFENVEPLKAAAAAYPDVSFAFLDGVVKGPNVTSVIFRELEGDFLVGALAAMLAEDDIVGFLGGADIDIIRRIEHGFNQGVRYIAPQTTILSEYAGGPNDYTAFKKPDLGYELASKMYEKGATVIYSAAGRTGLGVIRAAQEHGKLTITTSTDQRWIAPEAVIAGRTKNLDTAIPTLVREYVQGELEPGVRELDLKAGGIGLTPLSPEIASPDLQERVDDLKQKILDGKLTVSEYKKQ